MYLRKQLIKIILPDIIVCASRSEELSPLTQWHYFILVSLCGSSCCFSSFMASSLEYEKAVLVTERVSSGQILMK